MMDGTRPESYQIMNFSISSTEPSVSILQIDG
jgi:hypothetical protein